MTKISEVLKYKGHIFHPEFVVISRYTEYSKKTTTRMGTYLKPLARFVAGIAKIFGYKIRLRGRGERCTKYHNMNGDIRINDALFLTVYGDKRVK